MASGELATVKAPDLPVGFVITSSGRISGVTQPGDASVDYPFPTIDLVTLDDALTRGTRESKARMAVYIGDLGADPAARAREILADVPTPNDAVLLAVSPDQHAIEVVYGEDGRVTGTVALTALLRARGGDVFRVHDVAQNVQALRVSEALGEP